MSNESERDPLQECVGPRTARTNRGRVSGYGTSRVPPLERVDVSVEELTDELAQLLIRFFPSETRS